MRLRKVVLVTLTCLVICGVGIYVVWWFVVTGTVAAHQQSTTAELAAWGQEFATIRDANEASRALGMLEYIQHYYVVAPGYRSDPETEQRLESQRDTTVRTISASLDTYFGQIGEVHADYLRAAKAKILEGTRWEENK